MALLADPTYESRVLLGEILASWYRRTIVEPDDSGGVPRDVYSVVVSHAARYPERFMLLLEVVEQRRRGEKGESMVTEMQRSTALRSKAQRSPGVTGGRNLVVEDLGQEDMEMDLAETEEPCKVPVRDSSQHDETMGDAGPAVVSDHLHPPPPPPPPPPSLTPPTDSSKTQQSPPKVTAKEYVLSTTPSTPTLTVFSGIAGAVSTQSSQSSHYHPTSCR